MLKILLITITILLACVALLSVGIILKKGGKFPDSHIEGNKNLRDRGLRCAASMDYEYRNRKVLSDLLKK